MVGLMTTMVPGFAMLAQEGPSWPLLAGVAAGIFPALRAMRLTIVDALARA